MVDSGLVILGGGLAGLAASIYSCAPVYEAKNESGGVSASDTVEGFTFDRGIHVLQTQNQTVIELLKGLGVEMHDHSRQAYIYSHKTYTPYPFQVNTAGLPLLLRIRCLWDFLNRNREAQPDNYQEWMYRNIGRGFADTFLIPYSEKFWTIHPSEMTFEWTGNRVPKPKLSQVLRGAIWSKQTRIGTNSDFRYPLIEVGYGAIAEALTNKADKIHYEHRATRIDVAEKRVFFDNGTEVGYETLISTLPLPDLIAICSAVPDEVKAAVSKLRTNKIMVVNLGIDRPATCGKHWVHFPEKDISFFRISFPHNFADNMVPEGMSSISAEVAYSGDTPPDRDQLVERVIQDLIKVKALDADAPITLKMTKDIPYAYVIFDEQRKVALSTVQEWLKSVDIAPAGRYGKWAYFWSDEAILSGKKVAETLMKSKQQPAAG